ncbi:MAG TPA: LuxR family transcriptional regulator, partial [Thermodesulfovibrionia bacterium]|nr:LuxR family transcriptional regulator [Thermodesulfovibrionia bacterium]
ELRYTKQDNDNISHYQFDDLLERIEINTDFAFTKQPNIEETIFNEIKAIVANGKYNILIVDNLTYLKNETEKSQNALPFLKQFQLLKKQYSLSILVLAHTPKRDLSKPLTRNCLAGSKMLINFCDSAFAIGESAKDKGLRYLKQIKCRNSQMIYDTENVILCELLKVDVTLH